MLAENGDGECLTSIVLGCFDSVSWPDAATVRPLLIVLPRLTESLICAGRIDDATSTQLLERALYSLVVNGSDETLIGDIVSSTMRTYQLLRRHSDAPVGVLMSVIPGIGREAIVQLDSTLLNGNNRHVTEKVKKEMFKKVIRPIIGKKMSELHRRRIPMKQLPPLLKLQPRLKPSPLIDTASNAEDIGLCRLFN